MVLQPCRTRLHYFNLYIWGGGQYFIIIYMLIWQLHGQPMCAFFRFHFSFNFFHFKLQHPNFFFSSETFFLLIFAKRLVKATQKDLRWQKSDVEREWVCVCTCVWWSFHIYVYVLTGSLENISHLLKMLAIRTNHAYDVVMRKRYLQGRWAKFNASIRETIFQITAFNGGKKWMNPLNFFFSWKFHESRPIIIIKHKFIFR